MCGWPQGIQHERPVESVCGETLLEIKLKGMSCIVMNKKYIILANLLAYLEIIYNICYLSMKGNPWSHNEGYEESLQSRVLIMTIIEK